LPRRRPGGRGDRLPGAVVVGGDHQGLGIVRSLGRRGIPVVVVDDERSIARFSRYTTRYLRVGELRDERRTVDTILEIGAAHGLDGWVLYPTREETVAAFSRYRSELTERFRVPTPPWEVVNRCWDKRATYRLASELGVPTPRTWYPRTVEELDEVDGQPPFVIKPAIKEHFVYATKKKALSASSREELRALFEAASAIVGDGELMVQELIPGDGEGQYAYCAFFKDGKPVAKMAVRRRRQHPPDFGRASTFVETLELPELEAPSERFLREIDYYGLVELEYKRDPRDGIDKLLDVNARTWGYHTIGARAGVDFPFLLYADQMGQAVQECSATPDVRWIRLITDIPTAAVELFHRRLDWRGYLRSVAAADVEAVFSVRDPVPGLMEIALLPYLAVRRGM
jgi:predicted ATP-grasp superfamily ATP-dependent carboligase